MTADDVELQLAETRPRAFTRAGWAWELKFDGFRLLAERIGGRVRLVLRRGRDATSQFPEVVEALTALPGGDFVFDGELVIQDEAGHPIFQRLLKRSTIAGARAIEHARREAPAVYFAFDCLLDGEEDLRRRPLRERKARLVARVPKGDRVLPVDHVEAEGEALLEAVRAKGLEGVMGKDLSAPYRGGRNPSWVKVPLTHVADFAVVGHADDLGALYLATWDGAQFVYSGKVGSGFTPKLASTAQAEFAARSRSTPPCVGDVPKEVEARWVEPTRVAEVRFKNWPEGLSVREPVFVRFRDDKLPVECPTPLHGAAPSPIAAPAAVKVSNADKVLFPEDGLTKAELVAYYRDVSPWLLPYLKDRPLMLTRYPDGIHGKSFFQKALPLKAPRFVRSVRLRNEEERRDVDQLVCDDVRTLEWLANLATLPLHLGAGRVGSLSRADWAVIDFDPKGAPFAHVIELALTLHELCESAGLPNFVKTSGSSGLHVLIPLGRQVDHTGARQLAELLSTLVVHRHPGISTLERALPKREGKVYVDAFQNGDGKLIAAPFCVRPFPTAPVSMTLEWREVKPGLSPRQFTVRDAVARLQRVGDPMAPVLTLTPDLGAALAKLG